MNTITKLNSNHPRDITILISSKDKFIRNFSISPILPFLDNEDMNDSVDNPQSNSDSDNENETDPST